MKLTVHDEKEVEMTVLVHLFIRSVIRILTTMKLNTI